METGTIRKTISFYTLGCRLNQAETSSIQHSFTASEYDVVDFETPADVVVINTCTVTENGDADTRRLVQKVNRLNPRARIALIGCQAQIQRHKLTELPNVRWVIGNARKMELREILQQYPGESTPHVITPSIEKKSFTLPINPFDINHKRANLKIQDGCDFFCSFCEIPFARGRARSRQFNDILKEAQTLVLNGHREIVLTGINIGTYADEGRNFLDVIKALEDIRGLERIRISSIEPTTIPKDLVGHIAKSTKLCRFLHVPLQSGSDTVLFRMERKYTVKEFAEFIQTAYSNVKGLGLGTDVIVGFPGETESEFEKTCALLRELPFAYFHVFSYSRRQFAKSKDMPDAVPAGIIHERSKVLRELSCRKRRQFMQTQIGTLQRVLFETQHQGQWSGLTDHYVRVLVESNENLANQFWWVRLLTVKEQAMIAELSDNNGSGSCTSPN